MDGRGAWDQSIMSTDTKATLHPTGYAYESNPIAAIMVHRR